MADRVMADGRIAVIRTEDFYVPRQQWHLPAVAWRALAPTERMIRWHEQLKQRRLPRPTVTLDEPRYARIDAGRWLADCPCRSAHIVTPADPRMYCSECLTGWYPIIFPADVDTAEEAVAGLPAHRRFWWQPEDHHSWNRPRTPKQPTSKELGRSRLFLPDEEAS